jgi:hypothetical protein
MVLQVVEAFLSVKMDRADISVALYRVAPDIGGPAVVERVGRRLRKAIDPMFQTAPDVELCPDKFAIDMMLAAISGAMRSALEAERHKLASAKCGSIISCYFASLIWRR